MTRPLVIAHRGNSSAAPENTLSAFRSALELNVDAVELDYHHSADGVPIAFHDATLDRTTDAKVRWNRSEVRIADCTIQQLQQLDYGSWFGPDRQFSDEPLVTLDVALDLICGSGKLAAIERKSGDAETLIHLLRRKNLIHKVVVLAFDWSFLVACHQRCESLRLVALGDGPLPADRLDDLSRLPIATVNWDQRSLDAATIAAIHARGWQAWTWTVDDPQRMHDLMTWKIDAITTNHPARLLNLFG